MFFARTVAQMAAVFAKNQGGSINILKLMKLLYLADRESLQRHGHPISFDRMVSMDHGPALSMTYNLICGAVGGESGIVWDEWIKDRENHDVSLNRDFERSDLDHLSNADLEVLQAIWDQFGHMDQWQLKDYTHKNCGEWVDPDGSSNPITFLTVLREVGASRREAKTLSRKIESQRSLDTVFAGL